MYLLNRFGGLRLGLRNRFPISVGFCLNYGLSYCSLATDRRGRLYVHTDIRMLFSQKSDLGTLNLELEQDLNKYHLQSFTEMPRNPKYSSRK